MGTMKRFTIATVALFVLIEVTISMAAAYHIGSQGDLSDELESLSSNADLMMPSSFSKRGSVDFMGMRVSYPQYLRLKSIQKEVIKMDQIIRHMARKHNSADLAKNPHWIELLGMYDAMKKMLPEDYLATVGNADPIPI